MVAIGKGDEQVAEAAGRLLDELGEAGVEAVLDDRDAGPGEKLTDAELLGCPLRLVVGSRSLAAGKVEAQARAGGAEAQLEVESAAAGALAMLEQLE